MGKPLFSILISCLLIMYSCTKKSEDNSKIKNEQKINSKENVSSAGIKEADVEFKVEYVQPRRIYKIEKHDLNNDGNNEIIILSVAKDTSERFNDYYNFDMMEIFALNSEKKTFVKILSDTVDYSKDYTFENLSDDNRKQIIISTYSGGNDAIASKGMFIYSMPSNDKINLLKYFDSGAPQLEDIKKDGTKEILVSDEFWGVMPEVNVISFVKEIYKLENENLVIKNSEFGEFYDNKIKEVKQKYYELKKKVEIGMQPVDLSYPLYREAAEVIINYYAKDDTEGLRKFWNEEKDSLEKNIPHDEFVDLNNFISKVLPSAKNA